MNGRTSSKSSASSTRCADSNSLSAALKVKLLGSSVTFALSLERHTLQKQADNQCHSADAQRHPERVLNPRCQRLARCLYNLVEEACGEVRRHLLPIVWIHQHLLIGRRIQQRLRQL